MYTKTKNKICPHEWRMLVHKDLYEQACVVLLSKLPVGEDFGDLFKRLLIAKIISLQMFAAASAQPSGEEPAWTGFAMEQIMKTLSFVNSSLVQAPREEKEKLAHKLDDTLYCAKVQCADFDLKMGLITNHDESWMQCYRRHCYGNMF